MQLISHRYPALEFYAEKLRGAVPGTTVNTRLMPSGDAMQLHGGNGYTTERQVERYWRDARLTTIFEGTSQIQQKIISDRLLPKSPLG